MESNNEKKKIIPYDVELSASEIAIRNRKNILILNEKIEELEDLANGYTKEEADSKFETILKHDDDLAKQSTALNEALENVRKELLANINTKESTSKHDEDFAKLVAQIDTKQDKLDETQIKNTKEDHSKYVKSVNGALPDEKGNAQIDIKIPPEIKTPLRIVNNETGKVAAHFDSDGIILYYLDGTAAIYIRKTIAAVSDQGNRELVELDPAKNKLFYLTNTDLITENREVPTKEYTDEKPHITEFEFEYSTPVDIDIPDDYLSGQFTLIVKGDVDDALTIPFINPHATNFTLPMSFNWVDDMKNTGISIRDKTFRVFGPSWPASITVKATFLGK